VRAVLPDCHCGAAVHVPHATSDLTLWYELYSLELKYWFDVDFHGGHNAHEFYVADGLFAVGENRFHGHDRIRAFYGWRQRRGHSTSRHLISNLQVCGRRQECAELVAVLSLYRSDGRPPFHGERPPMLVADLNAVCVRAEDGLWRYQSHILHPLFVGSDIPLSISIDTEILGEAERTRRE
jgi:hypothetical protein